MHGYIVNQIYLQGGHKYKKQTRKMLTAGLVTAMVLGSVGVSETVVSRAESAYVSGTYNQFSPVRLYSTFKMINIYDYIKEEADATIASTYNSHNQKISVE